MRRDAGANVCKSLFKRNEGFLSFQGYVYTSQLVEEASWSEYALRHSRGKGDNEAVRKVQVQKDTHLKRHNPGKCGNYVGNFSFVKPRKMRMFFSELLQKQRWMNKNRTERKKRILMGYPAVFLSTRFIIAFILTNRDQNEIKLNCMWQHQKP